MFSGLLQPMHLLLILGVVLIVFGPGKLANVGHDLGKSIREFKAAMEARDVTPEAETVKPAQVAAAPAATVVAESATEKAGQSA
ncbi:twin-arginine translocase TatA/TatE family subunit [Solidesulfovibrio sp.]|uniref:twin-arginine translocase TatA/TatE family subunit n=1 Tax=Solidesulfovibrio sp. TaxID=2910990 RepID=UPI00262BC7CF|nr:twin-arginine translocase TatA/TatE family subunit [Solidesulfovibrio sp.]